LIKVPVNASSQQNSDVLSAVGIGPKYNSAIVEIYTIGTSGRHATNLGDDTMTFEFAINLSHYSAYIIAILSLDFKLFGPGLAEPSEYFEETNQSL
jgi:hypothetical protein